MVDIQNVMRKKYTWVIALIIFYESKTKKTIKIYRVLSCVLYYVIYNYVCIEYLCFQYQTLIRISSDKTFEQVNYKILLVIGIPELLMNLVSYQVFMKKLNLTVTLNCQYSLLNYHLSKGLLLSNTNLSSYVVF